MEHDPVEGGNGARCGKQRISAGALPRHHDLGGADRVPSTLSRISGATLPHTIVGQRGGATLTSCHISSAQRRFLVERALGEAATVLCMYSHSPT